MLVEDHISEFVPYLLLSYSEKLKARFCIVAVEICVYSATRALVKSENNACGTVSDSVHDEAAQWDSAHGSVEDTAYIFTLQTIESSCSLLCP